MRLKVPRSLGTLVVCWLGMTFVGIVALVIAFVQWLAASGWHVLLASALLGAVVVVIMRLRPALRALHHVPDTILLDARPARQTRRGDPKAPVAPPSRSSLRSSSPRPEIVYYGGRRIGIMDVDGHLHLDHAGGPERGA